MKKGTISPSCYAKPKNGSYTTQWHNKGFQNIKLVSHYLKSLSRKNSKCLDFVLVQVTCIVQKSTISLSCYTKSKDDSYSTQWHTKGFQNIKLVSYYSKLVSHKNSKCLDFVFVPVGRIVPKSTISFMLHKIKNDSYSTQWHTRGFQTIKLVSHYSKSASCKNSKCLDFVLVQVTCIAHKSTITLSCYTKSKDDSYSTQWHIKVF